ncbi:hypothetical protein [Actinomadura montaniterrae]|uniref:WD40 repeat domain-containing protein n=1 Tax=Actinomadura montaniterrae TaxID=1803903 RepID=A0A6L3VI06_9ACTN|nr:hypothetical protein [Actinomadura montaniterrae]KAB2370367.1 hypothetical protein F9B16_36090 [Actinomadura montaniterrae]
MNIERLLKDAAAAETREVTRESLPPLTLPAARRRPAGRRLVPVAAVAAVLTVITVVAVTVALRGALRGPDALGAHEGPPYFLATHRKGGVGVFDSWTGRMIADIRPRTGHYSALTLSADRRTAFLADEVGHCRTRIDKVTLRGDGTVAHRTTLPGGFGTIVDEMAATADGSRVALVFNNLAGCSGDDVAVVDSPSGATRAWRLLPPSADSPGFVQSPAWAVDGRTLFLASEDPEETPGNDIGIDLRALDTRTAGTDLGHARVVLKSVADLSSLRLSPDGLTVTAVKEDTDDDGTFKSVAVVELPVPIGDGSRRAPVRELASMTARQIAPAAPTDFRTTLDATGRHLLVSSRRDRAVFRLDDGRFHRLPDLHRTDLGLIAW